MTLAASAVGSDSAVERRKLYISGFMHLQNVDRIYGISFAILKALLPTLNRHDISGARIVGTRATVMGGEQILPDKPPSIIVRLVLPELVRNIMNARRSFTYFSTSNVDRSLLPPELAGSLPDCRILVNEVLSPSYFADYLSLKDTAKKLGFKFVWYCNGRILVR